MLLFAYTVGPRNQLYALSSCLRLTAARCRTPFIRYYIEHTSVKQLPRLSSCNG